jgi:hypothetical protein
MVGLYFGGQWVKTAFGNQYGNIELDANLSESHEWAAEATSFPVEVGAPVTDHVIEQSDKVTIKGFITDSPIISSLSLPKISKSQDVFELLYDLIKLKEPVVIYTKYKIYNDMILVNVSIPRSPGVGEAIEFDAEFIHIRKVETQIVDVPKGISQKKDKKASASLGKKAEQKKDAGKQQPVTVQKMSSTVFGSAKAIFGGTQ